MHKLEHRLRYEFTNTKLLKLALTHKSAGSDHNERLEFLGDAVLGYLIADCLYRQFPHVNEASLTLLRANLVKREGLASLARDLDLGRYIELGPGELRAGGQNRNSLLSNTVEALVGAILLDGGEAAARATVEHIFADRLAAADPTVPKDNKTRLQEYLQGYGELRPVYLLATTVGLDHRKLFTVECRVDSRGQTAEGTGASRKAAEQQAAGRMLNMISESGEQTPGNGGEEGGEITAMNSAIDGEDTKKGTDP